MASCYLNVAGYRFCILPVAQHEESLLQDLNMVHMKLVWTLISVTILSLIFLCKVVLFHPNEFWLELQLFLRNRFALTITLILYWCVLGCGFSQWHLAASFTRHCIQNSMSSHLYSARLMQVNRGFRSERIEKSGQQEI